MPAALRQTATRDIITDYETALCERFEVKHAFATTTEQDAAKAALTVAGVTPGSEVILSILSDYKVAASILAVGATPVFCDVYPHMFFSNAADMQRRITPKTSAIMVTGQWGTPGLGIEHEKLSKTTGLPTINYATTGLGSRYGKYEGAQALVNCFGTSSGLVMNAGQGGVVLTDDEQVAEKITALGLEKPKADVCQKGLYAIEDLTRKQKYYTGRLQEPFPALWSLGTHLDPHIYRLIKISYAYAQLFLYRWAEPDYTNPAYKRADDVANFIESTGLIPGYGDCKVKLLTSYPDMADIHAARPPISDTEEEFRNAKTVLRDILVIPNDDSVPKENWDRLAELLYYKMVPGTYEPENNPAPFLFSNRDEYRPETNEAPPAWDFVPEWFKKGKFSPT